MRFPGYAGGLSFSLAPFTLLALLIQLLFYIKVMDKQISGFGFPLDIIQVRLMASGLFFTLVAGEFCARIFHKKRRWGRSVLWLLLAVQILAGFYHIRVRAYFDPVILLDNAGALSSPGEVFYVLSSVFQVSDFFLIPLILLILSFFHLGAGSGKKIFSPVIPGALMVLMLILPLRLTDQGGYLLQRSIGVFTGNTAAAFIMESRIHGEGSFSYLQNLTSGHSRSEALPDIYLIMVESFNPFFVEYAHGERAVTPFFNSLLEKGVYVESFYGNSIQTAKGHVATLCSVLPAIRGKIMEQFPKIRLNCLPEVLANEGYQTAFYQAQYDILYDNTGPFFEKNGFEIVRAMDQDMLEGVPSHALWSPWGLQEDVFFEKVFGDLEKKRDGDRPLFCALATITNHMGFSGLPESEMRVVDAPESYRDLYMNSLAATDAWLKVFFEKLHGVPGGREALVIITGDHGHPMGESGTYAPQVGFGESNFRTPLLIVWPEKLKPGRIKDRPYTQVDIAPTLMDLLGIAGTWPWMGQSVFWDDEERMHYLVQPYNGQFFVVLQGRKKYVYGAELEEEYFFDLEKDPMGEENIIEKLSPEDLRLFRQAVARMYSHQEVIRADRIRP
ncbi:LTA synthase family protein [Desulfobotulus mexicanus]|uniref:Sulfatase-like hydrolase/transferase n=1 Tax=Desulfobotulus mexicanus TaxID=2586642 RepID=A0A5Q4VEU7_9BACT|nr:sulfatase-like hydrolase/transferase [Desulfobotulus mexicanus]TYT76194.1 sulfatase-like hydrolase/transferase [Desulfobotulus mexicanus]